MRKILFLLLLPVFILSCNSIDKTRNALGIAHLNVIFSFDDGPDEHTTPLLLDLLKKYEIKALFSLLGVNSEQYQQLVKRIHDEGHVIINHGYHDKHAILMGNEEFTDNLIRGEEAISSALGFKMHPKLYRPHGGYYTSAHEKILLGRNYSVISINIRAYDAFRTSTESHEVVNKIIKSVKKKGGGIILLHDAHGSYLQKQAALERDAGCSFNRFWIIDAAEKIITALLEGGFVLQHSDILAAINISN